MIKMILIGYCVIGVLLGLCYLYQEEKFNNAMNDVEYGDQYLYEQKRSISEILCPFFITSFIVLSLYVKVLIPIVNTFR